MSLLSVIVMMFLAIGMTVALIFLVGLLIVLIPKYMDWLERKLR